MADAALEEGEVIDVAASVAAAAVGGERLADVAGDGEGEEPAGERKERVVVKFLIPNLAAGGIIGKAGATITDIQTQSGARMQLSKTNDYFPGTPDSQDRILLVSGTVDQMLTALYQVMTKLRDEPGAPRGAPPEAEGPPALPTQPLQLRMLVHSRLCGTLIGKGGATIRSFNEDSRATFNISPPPTAPGITERVVKISGDVDELMRAVALVVTKLSENPDFHLLTDANLSYGARGGGGGGSGSGGSYERHNGGGSLPRGSPAPLGSTTATLGIPEDRVGVVIGKGGAVINQIKDLVNVNIRISKKGEHLPGTNDRSCQITGAPQAVELAQQLIRQKMDGGR